MVVSAGCWYKFSLQLAGQIPYRDAAFPKHLQHPLPEQGDACFFLSRLWRPLPYGQAGRCCAKQTLGNTCLNSCRSPALPLMLSLWSCPAVAVLLPSLVVWQDAEAPDVGSLVQCADCPVFPVAVNLWAHWPALLSPVYG